MTQRVKALSRRNFLLATGAGVAATAAALAARRSSAVLAEEKTGKRGYHASEHINNYYRTTKV